MDMVSFRAEHQHNLPEEYRFQSYFQVINMMAVRIKGDNELDFAHGIEKLIGQVVELDLEIRTPSFYLITQLEEDTYTDIMIGVC